MKGCSLSLGPCTLHLAPCTLHLLSTEPAIMFEYQRTNRFFAQVPDGMEDMALQEIAELGATNARPVYRGMSFHADTATLYRINYMSRHVTRVLAPIARFQCHSTEYLYKKAKGIEWSAFFSPDHTFAVFATVSHSVIRHSRYAALCLKDAIVDYFRERDQRRPSIQRIEPDVWINLHVENNKAVISFDTSAGSLHRRGYRDESVEAPMQEVLAAAIIKLSGWDGSKPLYDPMAGSGTLLMEALMAYGRVPSGLLRKRFGFELMPDFDAGLWQDVKNTALAAIRDVPPDLIEGSDISPEAVATARKNAARLPQGERLRLKVMDFRDIEGLEERVIITNPPYGIRLGKSQDLVSLYKDLGDFLKKKCKGSQAYIYFGNRELIPRIGLRPSWKKPLKSGGLDGRLAKFEMY
jgi:putative N6-adenine-specific DNA methylase